MSGLVRRTLALIGVAGALLTGASAAKAPDGKVQFAGAFRAQRALAIAADYWRTRESCPPETVQVIWQPLEVDIAGMAYLNGCRSLYRVIWLNRLHQLGWERWCTVIVHEYGHLIGMGHSPDPRSIMYHSPGSIIRVCRRDGVTWRS